MNDAQMCARKEITRPDCCLGSNHGPLGELIPAHVQKSGVLPIASVVTICGPLYRPAPAEASALERCWQTSATPRPPFEHRLRCKARVAEVGVGGRRQPAVSRRPPRCVLPHESCLYSSTWSRQICTCADM